MHWQIRNPLPKPLMGSGLIEVDNIPFEKPGELFLMENQEMIQACSPSRESHVPVADAVLAFLYFRSLVDESVLQLVEVQGVRDHQDIPWAESLYQVQALTNEILPALIEAALAETPSNIQ